MEGLQRPGYVDVSVRNPREIVYLKGDELTDGSTRFKIDVATGYISMQGRVSGNWQPTSLTPLKTYRVDTGDHITFDRDGADIGTIGASATELLINGPAGGAISLNSDNNDVDTKIGWDGGTALFVEGSSGNVGIGTANPGSTLDVAGNVTAVNFFGGFGDLVSEQNPDAVNAIRVKATGSDVDVVIGDASGYFSVWNAADNNAVFYVNNLGDTDIARNLTVDGTIINTDFTTLTDNSMADALHRHSKLSASDGTPDRALIVDATGNVGIGITNSNAKLHVYGTGADIRLMIEESAASHVAGIHLRTGSRDWFLDTKNGVDFRIYRDSEPVYFVINQAGNVGIGTSSPQRNLHIESGVPTIRLSDSNAATDQEVATLIEFYRGNQTNRVGYLGMASAGNDDLRLATDYPAGLITLRTGNSVTALTIDNSQNVGIGTASPGTKLDVLASGNEDAIRGKGGASGFWGGIFYDHDESNAVFFGDDTHVLRVDTDIGGDYSLVVDTIGNVGIGTNDSQATLHVVGTDGIIVPIGTTGQRVVKQGIVRYNTTTSKFEGYTGSAWVNFH